MLYGSVARQITILSFLCVS